MPKIPEEYLSVKDAKRMLEEHAFFDVETGNYKVEGGTYDYVSQVLDYCERMLSQIKRDADAISNLLKDMRDEYRDE